MDDKTKTLAAVAIIIGVVMIIAVIIAVAVTGKKTVSPVPDEGAIRIIFVSPTMVPAVSPSPTLTPTVTPKPKK